MVFLYREIFSNRESSLILEFLKGEEGGLYCDGEM